MQEVLLRELENDAICTIRSNRLMNVQRGYFGALRHHATLRRIIKFKFLESERYYSKWLLTTCVAGWYKLLKEKKHLWEEKVTYHGLHPGGRYIDRYVLLHQFILRRGVISQVTRSSSSRYSHACVGHVKMSCRCMINVDHRNDSIYTETTHTCLHTEGY